jgi:hypothetical protein
LGKNKVKGSILNLEKCYQKRRQLKPAINNTKYFNRQVEEKIFHGYDGSIDLEKRPLEYQGVVYLWNVSHVLYLLQGTGFNVLLSDPTSEKTIRLGQEYSLDEPVIPSN